jgi:hypothetical protein
MLLPLADLCLVGMVAKLPGTSKSGGKQTTELGQGAFLAA